MVGAGEALKEEGVTAAAGEDMRVVLAVGVMVGIAEAEEEEGETFGEAAVEIVMGEAVAGANTEDPGQAGKAAAVVVSVLVVMCVEGRCAACSRPPCPERQPQYHWPTRNCPLAVTPVSVPPARPIPLLPAVSRPGPVAVLA